MGSTQSQTGDSEKAFDLPKLREFLAKYFDMDELRLLCFNLGIDFEVLIGENKAGKTVSLVQYCERRNLIETLIKRCEKERPSVTWFELELKSEGLPQYKTMSETEVRQALRRLQELNALLAESWEIFVAQNKQRNRLRTLLFKNHTIPGYEGYNDLFYQLYDQMNQDELDLVHIIRGITEFSMFHVNEKLLAWVERNPVYELLPLATPSNEKLEEELLQLKIHFRMWFPKYYAVFLKDEKHSLVYLNDEKKQGIGFPRNLVPVLMQVMSELEAQL